jgi:hypothetical protein
MANNTPNPASSPDEPDSAWQGLVEAANDRSQQDDEAQARSAALEQLALSHARCDDAASACWYLCRSLGAARQLEPGGEPSLELLFELLGALADLPALATVTTAETQGEADGLGVFELCQQLQAAREQSQQAWRELTEADQPATLLH